MSGVIAAIYGDGNAEEAALGFAMAAAVQRRR